MFCAASRYWNLTENYSQKRRLMKVSYISTPLFLDNLQSNLLNFIYIFLSHFVLILTELLQYHISSKCFINLKISKFPNICLRYLAQWYISLILWMKISWEQSLLWLPAWRFIRDESSFSVKGANCKRNPFIIF